MMLLSTSATEARGTFTSYIVEGQSTESVAKSVRKAGGRVTHELPIIDGVSALLTPSAVALLHKQKGITQSTMTPASAALASESWNNQE